MYIPEDLDSNYEKATLKLPQELVGSYNNGVRIFYWLARLIGCLRLTYISG